MRTSPRADGIIAPGDQRADRLSGDDNTRAAAALPGKTGGNSSHGYIVQNGRGVRAFLKALDYARALKAPDPAKALQALTEAYNFERQVLERCRDKRLDRVVMAITDGTVRVSGEPVQYLILELADGDARSQAKASARLDIAWIHPSGDVEGWHWSRGSFRQGGVS